MSIVITRDDDGVILVTRNGDEGDDVVRETEANCKEDWAGGRMACLKAVDGGYEVTIDEDDLEYGFGTYPTLEEAEDIATGWVEKWPDGWCDAHFEARPS